MKWYLSDDTNMYVQHIQEGGDKNKPIYIVQAYSKINIKQIYC